MLGSWSFRRQLAYFFGALFVLAVVSAYPLYEFFYTAPTCSDGIQNQDEVGIDCGGSCPRLCATQVNDLAVLWARSFSLGEGQYDLAALIENQNTDAGIEELSYTITAYGAGGNVLAERSGTTYANPAQQFLIFEGGIRLPEAPTRTEVTFDDPFWVRADRSISPLTVKNKRLTDPDGAPRLVATVENTGVAPVRDVDASAVVYNSAGSVAAVSATYLNDISARNERKLYFTWPHPISTRPEGAVCTAPVDAMLVTDRSGSMDDDRTDPPQPLTRAKEAAQTFVSQMTDQDQVGLVTFATQASDPVDQKLTTDHAAVTQAITTIRIHANGTQHTNLSDAIKQARTELVSERAREDAKKALILLTDGIASRPRDPNDPNNDTYAETVAAEQAAQAHKENIEVYVVGLGKKVNTSFLQSTIASQSRTYYGALTSEELERIYEEIARVVCTEETFTTEVNVRTRNF